jgi:hypothetical protein
VKKGASHKRNLLKGDIIAPRAPVHVGNMRFCRETSLGPCSYLDPNIHGTLKPRRGTRHHKTFTLTYDETKTDEDPKTLENLIKELTQKTTPISGRRVGCNTA